MNELIFQNKLAEIEFFEDEVNVEQLDDLVDSLNAWPENRSVLPYIFDWFEQKYDKHLGSPGLLVHFVEKQDDYHDFLKSSIERKPTELTVWMVNRICNALSDVQKRPWLVLLQQAVVNPAADDIASSMADEYLEYQGGI
jgi:hypothetical protein